MARVWSNPPPKTAQAILEQFDDKLRLQVACPPKFVQNLKSFVQNLNAVIPAAERDYDRRWQRWAIDASHAEAVIDLLKKHGFRIEDIRKRPKKWASVSWCMGGGGVEWITEHFYPSEEAALLAKAEIDEGACGGRCSNQHTVELRTLPRTQRFKRWNAFHGRYQPVQTWDNAQKGQQA